ncbi:MAG: hypothetical protein HQK54_17185 [Oligoflexales bacterium]|nr:hypothetical protein [Oligoflexales bacterium]
MRRSCLSGLLCILAAVLSFSGCAAYSVHIVNAGGFESYSLEEPGKMVSATYSQTVNMGFKGNVDYVDKAYANLLKACPKGFITGITTQYRTSLGFFKWKNHIIMRGRCILNREPLFGFERPKVPASPS